MEKQKKMPQLRFPEFAGAWESMKLGSIAKFSKGKGISKNDISEVGDTECIRYGQLYTHYHELINEVISKTNIAAKDLVLSEENDVIIPASGETHIDIATASCVLKSGIALGGDLNIIKTKNNGVFLSFYLNYKKKLDIANLAQGISVVHLYSNQLALLSLNIPTLPEQQKIASFFTAIDQKIFQLKRKKDLLEQYKKGVMQKIFSQEIRFKDNDGKEFQKWEKKKLGEVYNITSSKRVFQDEWTKSGVPFYRAREIVKLSESGYVDNELFISNEMYDEYKSKYGVPQKNDLLVTGVGTIGVLYVVKENEKFYFKDGNIIWFKSSGSINSQFVKHLFRTRIIRKQIEDNASITTVGTYTIESANKTVVPFPNIREQTKIANFLSAIDDKINHTQEQIEKTMIWKKGLLQQMFV
jgi:type I restriction enzyme S subunit